MLELVLANLRVRPLRTLISVVGVALGVTLVILFTGLARGMTNDMEIRSARGHPLGADDAVQGTDVFPRSLGALSHEGGGPPRDRRGSALLQLRAQPAGRHGDPLRPPFCYPLMETPG